ncbi:MAG: sulfatase [Planctomycetes bacterium]|nr:sulfatase [Planctomycetota bacterium]
MQRREFLKTSTCASLGALLRHSGALGAAAKRPNVLVIMTDQQFADAMSCCIGRTHLHTPNMDSLAAEGVRFTRAYSANPLCVPLRTSLFTGRYPHETGIQTNEMKKLDPEQFVCMGRIFKAAGYETGFFGKWHMPFPVARTEEHGFDTVVGSPGHYDGAPAAKFLLRDHRRPFLAVVSFMNPHDICEWSRGQELRGGGIGEAPAPAQCPPLKPNMDIPKDETDTILHLRRGYQAHRLFPVGHFTDDKWRQYLWAYYRLTEKVDQNVGTVLDALRQSGREKDTVVLFLSDHGECHGTHRWNQKTVFYDESSRVPFILCHKGVTRAGVCDTLLNTGVDVLPTLCEFAGIDVPAGLPGRSLYAQALGRTGEDRPYIVISNRMIQCEPVDGVLWQPDGRMVRSRRYKYCLYSLGQRRESLVDMETDPGEMTNLAAKPDCRAILLQHRGYLRDFARRHDDRVALSMLEGLDT